MNRAAPNVAERKELRGAVNEDLQTEGSRNKEVALAGHTKQVKAR